MINKNELYFNDVMISKSIYMNAFFALKKFFYSQKSHIVTSELTAVIRTVYLLLDAYYFDIKNHENFDENIQFITLKKIVDDYVDIDQSDLTTVHQYLHSLVRFYKVHTLIEYLKTMKKKQYQIIHLIELYPEHLFYLPASIVSIQVERLHELITDEMLQMSQFKVNQTHEKMASKPKAKKIDFSQKRLFYKSFKYPIVKDHDDVLFDGLGMIDLEVLYTMKQSILTFPEMKKLLLKAHRLFDSKICIKMPDITKLFFGSPIVDIYSATKYNQYQELLLYGPIIKTIKRLKLEADVAIIFPTFEHVNQNYGYRHDMQKVIQTHGFYVEAELNHFETVDIKKQELAVIDFDALIENLGRFEYEDDFNLIEKSTLQSIHSSLRIQKVEHRIFNMNTVSETQFRKLLNMGFTQIELTGNQYQTFFNIIKDYKNKRKTLFL